MFQDVSVTNYRVKWQPDTIREGSRWFRRIYADCKKISPHIRLKRIKYGFYRIYWRSAYLHEAYKEMPMVGYQFEDYNPRLESRQYYEELEDREMLTRTIKNYKEGYYDALDRIRTRVYLMRTQKEAYDNARNAYKTRVIH